MEKNIINVAVDVRLRPVRLAFLVRTNDRRNLQTVFEINSCLWGGRFNAIIPIFSKIPAWWDRNQRKADSPSRIRNGYVEFFEPDFIVETEPKLGADLNFDKSRILSVSDLLGKKESSRKGGCTTVDALYSSLYQNEFKFKFRKEPRIATFKARQAQAKLFCACVFGTFPATELLEGTSEHFSSVFNPQNLVVSAETIEEIYSQQLLTPLRIGWYDIDVQFNDRNEPLIFVFNLNSTQDLIDLWNLRALHHQVLPVPLQWISQLSKFSKSLIAKNYRPMPYNSNGIMIRTTVLYSRTIPTQDISQLHAEYFLVSEKPDATLIQDWYPNFWSRPFNSKSPSYIPTLAAKQEKVDVPFNSKDGHLRFSTLSPDFLNRHDQESVYTNVVRLNETRGSNSIATAFPCDMIKPLRHLNYNEIKPFNTTEGLLTWPKFYSREESWSLPDGTKAITTWLSEQGITAHVSESGRATEQIIRTIGGFAGVSCLAHKSVVLLLNELASKHDMKSMHCKMFKSRVEQETQKDIWMQRTFEALVKRGVVKIGLQLRCSNCGELGWHELKELGAIIRCSLCLKDFDFPATDAERQATWAYRAVGPFSIPDFARGGYAAALTIRCFAEVLGVGNAAVSWAAGHELTFSGRATPIEADFMLWYQRTNGFGHSARTNFVLGEAKSFGREAFGADDAARIKYLATKFPGSFIVFATLKDASDLSKFELRELKRLAKWGRKKDIRLLRPRASVIILTGTELFCPHTLSEVWQKLGGEYAGFAGGQESDLATLAGITQHLYLGIDWVPRAKSQNDATASVDVKA